MMVLKVEGSMRSALTIPFIQALAVVRSHWNRPSCQSLSKPLGIQVEAIPEAYQGCVLQPSAYGAWSSLTDTNLRLNPTRDVQHYLDLQCSSFSGLEW